MFEWILISVRWIHITTAITWIGTSFFFMWLDRTFINNELWMVHGGGFYRVQKLKMGDVEVPDRLHWFKWESYWTWFSGIALLTLMFYSGDGALLLDPDKATTYWQALSIGIGAVVVSWLFYDWLWENSKVLKSRWLGHLVTILWTALVAYILCLFLGGRGAYMHLAAVIGTWMSGNVFLRIIPRQFKMVEATKKKLDVDPRWALSAKFRSTHNTYFTLPMIFLMLSNHYPITYGHRLNWLLALMIGVSGALIRHFFVVREAQPGWAKAIFAAGGLLLGLTAYISMEVT